MKLRDYLATASPEQWHQVAWSWNWDSGQDTLRWIIQQPTCDGGTALLVYWYGGPRYYAQYRTRDEVPDYELAGYDLVMEIERRYLAGGYTQQEIAFDPRADQSYDWTTVYADFPNLRPISEEMYRASPGHVAARDDDFDEGYPLGVEPDGSEVE